MGKDVIYSEQSTGAVPRRRVYRLPVVLFVCAFVPLFVYGLWSVGGQRVTEVDVNSGRVRVRTEWFGRTVAENILPWSFADAVTRHGLAGGPPDYRFAWSSPAGASTLLGERHATGARGHVLADLQSIVQLADRFGVQWEAEQVARALQLLREADQRGMADFGSEIMSQIEAAAERS